MSNHKVSIIGAGNVGATATYYLAEKVIADLVMVDVAGGMTQAKALDFLHKGDWGAYGEELRKMDDILRSFESRK